jgi:hypothetical protein
MPVELKHLPSGIYEITLHHPTADDIDDWVNCYIEIYRDMAPTDHALMLLDVTTGLPPLVESLRKMQQYVRDYPNRPHTRTAFIRNRNVLTTFANGYFKSVMRTGKDQLRFFEPHQRDYAIEWLLSPMES